MALDQSALTDLLDALRSGGDLDFMREAMQLVLQAQNEPPVADPERQGARASPSPASCSAERR